MKVQKKGMLLATLVLTIAAVGVGCAQKTSTLTNVNSIEAAGIKVEETLSKPLDKSDDFSINTLTGAVLCNDQEKVTEILASGKVDVNSKDTAGQYPLELSLVIENLEMAKLLFEGGADQNLLMSSDETIKEKVLRDGSEAMKALFKEYEK